MSSLGRRAATVDRFNRLSQSAIWPKGHHSANWQTLSVAHTHTRLINSGPELGPNLLLWFRYTLGCKFMIISVGPSNCWKMSLSLDLTLSLVTQFRPEKKFTRDVGPLKCRGKKWDKTIIDNSIKSKAKASLTTIDWNSFFHPSWRRVSRIPHTHSLIRKWSRWAEFN